MQQKSCKLILALALTTLAVASTHSVRAQENLLSDISYLYLDKLIATAKENYPRLKRFQTQVSAAKTDLSAAKAGWFESLSFQYVTRNNQASTSAAVNVTTADVLTGYQFGVALNAGSLLARPSQIKKARAQIKTAEFDLEEYNLTLEAEVKRRYFVYMQMKSSLTSNVKAFLDAESNYKTIRLKYEKSEAKLEEFNAASIAFSQANLTKLQNEANFLISKSALEELTVRKLEEIK